MLRQDAAPTRPSSARPRVLMLGKGWFPDELGGLNRYYRALLTELPEARGVVVGPGADAPSRVSTVSSDRASVIRRVVAVLGASTHVALEVDIVDVHFALYGLLPVLSPVLRRKPLVVHFQGPWADESLAAGKQLGWRGWRTRAKRLIERSVYRRAAVAVTLTQAFKQVLVSDYGVDAERVHVIRPGVDTEAFSPGDRVSARAQFDVPDDAFVVCCARRLVPRMGIDLLLDAWEVSLAADPQAHLIIAGAGELLAPLRRRVAERGWSDRVQLPGRITNAELLALYRAADVNVVPSLAFEGFGLTVLEAASCGTPTIVTDVGGLPEAVAGLGSNLVTEAGSARMLAERLDQARGGQLPPRDEARAWAVEQSWQRCADVHREMYSTFDDDDQPSSRSDVIDRDGRSADVSVVVPSFRRPDQLRRCLKALTTQSMAPRELIVVLRSDDDEGLAATRMEAPLARVVHVDVAGQVAALNAGREAAVGAIIAMTDDDAAPHVDWVERLTGRFATDHRIGAVGGRDIVHRDGGVVDGVVTDVGRVRWWGRAVGNHHLQAPLQDVDFLKGANMAYRAAALMPLNTQLRGDGAEICNDLEASWSVRQRGWRVVYDPSVAVDHHPAERHNDDKRAAPSVTARCNTQYNELYGLALHASVGRALAVIVYRLVVGTRAFPGPLLALLPSSSPKIWRPLFTARFSATRDVIRHRRQRTG